MIEGLLNKWSAMRAVMQAGLGAGDENEAEELEVISQFQDQCVEVADDGRLDQAVEMALRVFEADMAGEFYRDVMEVASVYGHPIQGDDWEGIVKTRLFGIPVIGDVQQAAVLHHDDRLGNVFRDAGFAKEEASVFFMGAVPLDEGSRLSPQTVWNLTKAGTFALAKIAQEEAGDEELLPLRNMVPLVAEGDQKAKGRHPFLVMGLRFDVEIEGDPVEVDPLHEAPELSDQWDLLLAANPGIKKGCALLAPRAWTGAITQALLVSCETAVLASSGLGDDIQVGKVMVSPHPDRSDISWFDIAGTFLGTHSIPSTVSFWALSEIIHELSERGTPVELASPHVAALASMPSPGRLLN